MVYIQCSFSNVNGIAAVYDYSELRMSLEAFVILWKMQFLFVYLILNFNEAFTIISQFQF